MQQLNTLTRNNRLFFIVWLLLVCAAGFILLYYNKKDGFYLLNGYHSAALNTVFQVFTFFGDGFFVVAASLVIYFLLNRFVGVLVLSSYLLSGIIAQVLKMFVVEARPAVYLKDTTYPNFIDQVTLHNYHAFPSGHTASAFAMAAVLSFAVVNKSYSLLFILIACTIGYSRIYLGQHFLVDVFAGCVIGVLSAVVCWLIFFPKKTAIEQFRKAAPKEG